jgi:hypothetical protein
MFPFVCCFEICCDNDGEEYPGIYQTKRFVLAFVTPYITTPTAAFFLVLRREIKNLRVALFPLLDYLVLGDPPGILPLCLQFRIPLEFGFEETL